MKKVIKKLFGQKGFSLPEVMIAVGLMGGMSLLVSQVVKQTDQVKKSSQTNSSSFSALYEIQTIFQDKETCFMNLKDQVGLPAPGTPLQTIINRKGILRYRVGETYDGGAITLTGLSLIKSGNESFVEVAITKSGNKKENGLNAATMKKTIPINAEYDGDGELISCQSDIKNHVDEAVTNAKQKICAGQNMSYDPTTKRCFTKAQVGTLPSYSCTSGTSLVALQLDNGEYKITCEDSLGMNGSCSPNQLLRRNTNKTFSCVDLTCPGTSVFQGLDENGAPICKTCASGESLTFTYNFAECRSLLCPDPGTYMAGIDSSGRALCNPLVDSSASSCANGKLEVGSNGQLVYNCCTPNCSDAVNQCSGSSFNSANNCGQCSGTKLPVCSDSANHCTGTSYPATNGCGICNGTRPPSNSTWGPWSECTNGTRTRTCNNDLACGGASCMGDSIEECGTKSWQCQYSDIGLVAGETQYWEAYKVRLEPMDWEQIRPDWPTIKTPGNHWQQGNHQWCVNECIANAENRYKTSLQKVSGKTQVIDQNMSVTVGAVDAYFQDWVNYNQGVPQDPNDQSGWWCGCMMKLHTKSNPPTLGTYPIKKARHEATRERAQLCVLNGILPDGGSPAPEPGPGPAKRDGGWSAWSAWSTCYNGSQYRSRTCTNPKPAGYGAECAGSASENQACASPDTCLPSTCPSNLNRYFFATYNEMSKVCGTSGSNCQATNNGSTCYHKGKSPYSYCSSLYPYHSGFSGLQACTYQGLTYYSASGCTW